MSSTELEAYLGIPMPSIGFLNNDDQSRHALYDTLDDLANCTGKLDFQFGSGIVTPQIDLLSDDARKDLIKARVFKKQGRLAPRQRLKSCEVLRFKVAVPEELYGPTLSVPEGIDPSTAFFLMTKLELCKRISDLLVMCNIARLGSIELADSVLVYQGESIWSSIPRMEGLAVQEGARLAKTIGWPTICDLNCETAWSWASTRNSHLDGFDGTKVGRALCAFSRLFEPKTSDEPMQLLWALVGLEALYVKGKYELLQQVREKSQIFLGPQESFKKKITQMYDFRSRFVHGDLDFPGLCLMGDARKEFAKYGDDLFDAIAIAVAVLAATLREIIRRGWSELAYTYSVSDIPNKPNTPTS